MSSLSALFICSIVLVACAASAAAAQDAPVPTTVPEMWNAWCARCHAKDGSGKVAEPTVTVEPMDFTDCSITTPEGDSDWEAVIAHGGPIAGLSSQMPAFGDALKPAQISEFVALIKTFCREQGWPSGNLNLPRPLFAEKAFPENEFILAPAVSHRKGEATSLTFAAIYERRFGKRAQIEMVLPLESAHDGATRNSGVGDFELGVKYALTPGLANFLMSAGFDVSFPTGKASDGLGHGLTLFEPYVSAATVIGAQTYLQAQLKFEFPSENTWQDRATIYHLYLGHDLKLLPSTWTFGIELTGENREVALAPQIRRGLSKSGALAGAFGVRLPLNKREDQGVTWLGYLLWEYLEPVRSRR